VIYLGVMSEQSMTIRLVGRLQTGPWEPGELGHDRLSGLWARITPRLWRGLRSADREVEVDRRGGEFQVERREVVFAAVGETSAHRPGEARTDIEAETHAG
jgi:hypothetical protein